MRGGMRTGAGRPSKRWQTHQLPRVDIRELIREERLGPGASMRKVGISTVPIEWEPCRFGGSRPWFLCPCCGNRRAVLYVVHDVAMCVRCGRISYSTQALSKFDRSWHRTRKIEARLGCADSQCMLPTKPKGMHWDTFSRLFLALRHEQALRNRIILGWAKPFFRDQEMGLRKIISGGQTGADRAALDAALDVGFPCGGWCPEGRLAEDGPLEDGYPLEVLPGAGYRQRTIRNLTDADGTVIFYFGRIAGGTKLTLDKCIQHQRPHLLIDGQETSSARAVEVLANYIEARGIKVLNVAGPRESSEPGIYQYTFAVMRELLAL